MGYKHSIKKITAFLLLATMLIAICSCRDSQPNDVPPTVTETDDSWNGEYYGLLDIGVWETINISSYNDKSFSFSFAESGISGDAEFSDDGYAYYYDDTGQAINFKFENNEILVDAGYRYGSLAATYTRSKNVTTKTSDQDNYAQPDLQQQDQPAADVEKLTAMRAVNHARCTQI